MTNYNLKDLRDNLNFNGMGIELYNYDDSYICDAISEIADSNVDIYTYQLFEWAKYNYDKVEEANEEFGASNDILQQIKAGQYLDNEQKIYDELDEAMQYVCFSYLIDKGVVEITKEQLNEIENKCTNVDNNDRISDFTEFVDELTQIKE